MGVDLFWSCWLGGRPEHPRRLCSAVLAVLIVPLQEGARQTESSAIAVCTLQEQTVVRGQGRVAGRSVLELEGSSSWHSWAIGPGKSAEGRAERRMAMCRMPRRHTLE